MNTKCLAAKGFTKLRNDERYKGKNEKSHYMKI